MPILVTGTPGVGYETIGSRFNNDGVLIDRYGYREEYPDNQKKDYLPTRGHAYTGRWYLDTRYLRANLMDKHYWFGFGNNWEDLIPIVDTVIILVADPGTLVDRIISYRTSVSNERKKAWDFTEQTRGETIKNLVHEQEKMIRVAYDHNFLVINTGVRPVIYFDFSIPGMYLEYRRCQTIDSTVDTIRSIPPQPKVLGPYELE